MDLGSLSVIIPAYNEESRLPDSLESLFRYFSENPMPYEVVVVDDGSTDNTRGVVEKWQTGRPQLKLFSLEKNCGKGAALARGVQEAQMKWSLIFDADGSMPIDNIEVFSRQLTSEHQILIASRDLPTAQQDRPPASLRHYLGRGFVHLRKRVIGLKDIEDTQCGFKLFPQKLAAILFENLSTSGFIFDVEVLGRAQKLNVPIKEVGVHWSDQPSSKVNVARELCRVPWALFKIWKSLRKFTSVEVPETLLVPEAPLETASR